MTVSAYINQEKVELDPNNKAAIMVHPPKQSIMDCLTPKLFEIHPEENPPMSPPTPNNIIAKPLSFCPSLCCNKLWTHVGNHEKTAHRPINIVPKITVPCRSSARYCLTSSKLDILEIKVLDCFHGSDSLSPKRAKIAKTKGIVPNRNPSRHSDSRFTIPEENIPIGNPIETIPIIIFLEFFGQTSDR